jgi:1-phosphofructokinase
MIVTLNGAGVTRALCANGHASVSVLPIWGAAGVPSQELTDDQGLPVRIVRVGRAKRTNVIWLTPADVATLSRELLAASRGAEWAVLCGSPPPGAPDDLYAVLTKRLHEAGVRVAVDTDWRTVHTLLGGRPELIKLSRSDLSRAAGLPVGDRSDALAAIDRLRGFGAGTVVAELGADGTVLVDETGTYHAEAVHATPHGTPGCGDAFLAGLVASGGSGAAALPDAVAWGSAAVTESFATLANVGSQTAAGAGS